jgi:hypothetical protein
MIAGPGRLCH